MSKANDLISRAQTATGLEDFGEDSFREGLEILVSSADRQARLNERGRMAFDGMIVDHLSKRLEVEHWYALHPEIDEQEIVAPLIGLGLPRTGSTALSCLLAEDPAARSIRTWEAQAPCPPPEKATEHTDPRIARSEAHFEQRARNFPRMVTMVPSAPTSPSECQTFMAHDFKSQLFLPFAHMPDYANWLIHEADLVPTYRYVKRVLKLLQWHCPPPRWRLKNPAHMIFIDALDQVFPDARYWMTHRDIASVLPSAADLYYEMTKAFSDQVDRASLARLNEEMWEIGLKRLIAFRDAGRNDRFFDIHFAPFQRDPFPTLAKLYEFLSEDLTDEARRRMQGWRDATPRDKHGVHTVDAAEFGIDLAAVREHFRFYTDRFGVAVAT
jgi:hypothetical protein